MNISNENFLQYISQIDKIPPENQELMLLAKKHLQTLEKNHDDFVKQAKENGYDLKSADVGVVEVRFLTLMKMISEKLGLPVEKYEEQIKNIKIRVFGEENYKRFFKK